MHLLDSRAAFAANSSGARFVAIVAVATVALAFSASPDATAASHHEPSTAGRAIPWRTTDLTESGSPSAFGPSSAGRDAPPLASTGDVAPRVSSAWLADGARGAPYGPYSAYGAPSGFGCYLPYIFGNVWDDREVNAKDALWLLRKIGGFLLPGGGNPCAPMDVDCDGDADAVDALTLLRWVAALPVHQHEDCMEIGALFGPYSAYGARATFWPYRDSVAERVTQSPDATEVRSALRFRDWHRWGEPTHESKSPARSCFLPLVMGDVWGRYTVEPNPEEDIDSGDALFILRKIAGFFLPGAGVTCSPMDIDCDFDIDPADALWILRWIAGLPYNQAENCIEIGTPYEPDAPPSDPMANRSLLWASNSGSVWEQALPAAPGVCNLPLVMGDVWGRDTAQPSPQEDIDALDAMFILRKIAGFFLPGGGVTCSPMDIDCDLDIDAVDALWILSWIAGLGYHQEENCIPIGTPFGPYS